jgi:CheY-like chemotaxis protein
MRPAAIEKGLQFEIIRSQPLPEIIRTDSARLKQCLINLVNNAVRFTDKGHVYVRVFWDNSGSKPFIRFDIEDTEPRTCLHSGWANEGRAEAALPANLKFSRPAQMGAGLGLTITQRLAELLGGSVTISGTTGKGSVFTLIIPTGMQPAGAVGRGGSVSVAGQVRQLSVQTDNLQLGGRVLVAEDSPTNQALIELLLKKLGIEVVVVENGRQAVQKAMTEKFDIILMDIQMPVMNGYEATKHLRKEGIKIPIIALTACAMKGDDEECFAAGCSGYLPKPIDRKKLIETLSRYLSAEAPNRLGGSADTEDKLVRQGGSDKVVKQQEV